MLSGYDLVVMDGLSQPSSGALGLLEEFVRGGGSVLVIPDSAAIGAQAACSALGLGVPKGWLKGEGQVSEVRWTHPLYREVFRKVPSRVDWPRYDRILDRRMDEREEMLVRAANGMAYLSCVRGSGGAGSVFLLGTCLETGNFTRHSLFVPTLLRIAESSRNSQARRCLLGRDQSITLALPPDMQSAERNQNPVWSMVKVTDLTETPSSGFVPEARTTLKAFVWAGAMPCKILEGMPFNKTEKPWRSLGLNPRASESQLLSWLPEEWTQTTSALGWPDIPVWGQPTNQINRLVEQHIAGERLAWYFFLAAIVALAFETLLLRRWNNLFS